MNILYLTNHLNIGGITSYVLTLATGLKKRGHNIYIASSGGELLSEFIANDIIFIPTPIRTKSEISPKILISLFRLSSIIKDKNINIIHSHSRTTQVLGYLLSRITAIPHISTCHGFFKKRFSRRAFGCWGVKVIAISQPVKEHLIKDFNVDEKDIVVIYNGIDINKFMVHSSGFRVERKKALGLGSGPVVGIVARLSAVKGHIYLIEAMKIVLEKIPGAQLLIVGDGRLKRELLRLSSRLGIEDNVFFMPSVRSTQGVLSAMDLFVMPSLKEGLGLALMEAMASGLAVIGSEIGGIRSLIKDNDNGILIKPADSGKLASAILGLLQDYQKSEALGRQAQIFISQNFSQEKMVLETQGLYSKCSGTKN